MKSKNSPYFNGPSALLYPKGKVLFSMVLGLTLILNGSLFGQAIEKGMAVVTQYADTNNTSNLVARLFDTRNNTYAPKGQDWLAQSPQIDITPSSWTLANLGEVFGISIDSIGNVYFAASDIYHMDSVLATDYKSYHGPAGSAGIYRADAAVLSNINAMIGTTNAPTSYPVPTTMIPNTGGIGNGIGNLTYDQKHHQLFASNLEDGRIYRIDLKQSPPQVVSIYDPLAPDDGQAGIAPRQEQIWGLGIHTDTQGITKLYFSRRGLPPSIPTEIHTLPLQSNGEFGGNSLYDKGIYRGGSQVVISLNSPTSDTSKITDIAFAEDGRMLLAERGHPHRASVYEYRFNGTIWTPTSHNFYVGGFHLLQGVNGSNAAGGVDYGYKQQGNNVYGHCDSTVWVTANYLLTPSSGSGFYYGIEGISAGGNRPITQGTKGNGFTDWVIDLDASSNSYLPLGDVEIYRSSCATSWKGPINHILACNDLLQVSLGIDGTIQLNADIVTQGRGTNPCWVFEVFTPNGDVIPNALLTCEWVGQTLDYQVRDTCTNNSCWGSIKLEDKYTPPILCKTDTIRCHNSLLPDSIGFPIPSSAIAIPTQDPQRFIIENWDSCGEVTLWYSDQRIEDFSCASEYKVIVRQWNSQDIHGNTNRCFDTIRIKRPTFTEDLIPLQDTILSCDGHWAQLPNGAPDPSVTGRPILEGCDWINSKFKDDITLTCGEAFRILRKWTLTDWCGKGANKVKEIYQSIEIRDDVPPKLTCPNINQPIDTISTNRYSCSANYELPIPNRSPQGIIVTDNCSDWQYRIKYIPPRKTQPQVPDEAASRWLGSFKRATEGPFYVTGLGLGSHWFEYEIKDDCGNRNTCRILVYVADLIPPDIVCEGHTQISLNDVGTHRLYASSIDDGTTDNCGLDRFLIRRADRISHCGQSNASFQAFTTFCCEDVGKTIMVELLAIDQAGNKASCMVDVSVSEKYPPVIIPPTDLTIDCRFDYDPEDLGSYFGKIALDESRRKEIHLRKDNHYSASNDWYAGIDGLATDNCGPITLRDTAIFDLECKTGTIRRIFYATDAAMLKDSAVQIITIEDLTPFTEKDIHWPADILDDPFETDCINGITTDPSTRTRVDSAYGYRNLDCAHIAVTYSDKIFVQEEGACYKIARTWTVVDWCTFEQNNRQQWVYTQLIKVANHTPPVIAPATCEDTVVCDSSSYSVGGTCTNSIHFIPKATDDCTPSDQLKWSYRLDIGNSGTFGTLKQSSQLFEALPTGTHRVKWYVEDACGNISSCIKKIEIQDCKPPTPYCRDQIVTVPMSSSGTVSISAKQFDLGASDNCTPSEDLIFSFTEDGNTPQIVLSCSDLRGRQTMDTTLTVYVIDNSGNSDFCTVEVRLQANDNCKSENITLSGKVEQYNGVSIPDIEISVYSQGANQPIYQKKVDGAYIFEGLRPNNTYELHARQQSNWKDGINTRDLVYIQKYLLNKLDFDEAWRFIAADANGSNTISTADISVIKKLILGRTNRFKKTDSWALYDANIEWHNINKLRSKKGLLRVNAQDEDISGLNWIGIKVGDVTGDRNGLRSDPTENINLKIEVKSNPEKNELAFVAKSEYNVEGLQGTFTLPGNIKALKGATLPLFTDDYALYPEGTFTLAWFTANGLEIGYGDTLFTVLVEPFASESKTVILGDAITTNLVFGQDGSAGRLIQVNTTSTEIKNLTLFPCYPNPAGKETTIRFENPTGEVVHLEVYNNKGEMLRRYEIVGKKGYSEFTLELSTLQHKGVLLYRLSTKSNAKSGKIVVQ